ncbi:TPA: sel1 repeat family protein [Vibrio harveyi]|nr:sel1 repeat family protein [Vibrio harveyi]HDM8182375.1 sel1 repeat family protein [Vibrio harveyi]
MAFFSLQKEKEYWKEVKDILFFRDGVSRSGEMWVTLLAHLITVAGLFYQGFSAIFSTPDVVWVIIFILGFVCATSALVRDGDKSGASREVVYSFYCCILKAASIYLLFHILWLAASTEKGLILDVSIVEPYITFGADFRVAILLVIAFYLINNLTRYVVKMSNGRFLPFYDKVTAFSFFIVAFFLVVSEVGGIGLDLSSLREHYFDDANLSQTLCKLVLTLFSIYWLMMYAIGEMLDDKKNGDVSASSVLGLNLDLKSRKTIYKSVGVIAIGGLCFFALTGKNSQMNFEEAVIKLEDGDVATAFTSLLKLSNSGQPNATEKLGDLYRAGDVVTYSPERALTLYEDAMSYGLTSARFKAGEMYFRAEGMSERQLEVAQDYITKSSDEGYFLATEFLAREKFVIGHIERYKLFNSYIELIGCVESEKISREDFDRLILSANEGVLTGIFGKSKEHDSRFEVQNRGKIESKKGSISLTQCGNAYTSISTARVVY